MIVFDLRCAAGHVFESWFGSSASFEDQREAGLVACPLCGDTAVEKAVMAPRVAAKGGGSDPPSPEAVKSMLRHLATAQAKALENSRWVGKGFAEQARAMHEGTAPRETIHGQATPTQAKAMIDDGVPVAPLPLPIVPPERAN